MKPEESDWLDPLLKLVPVPELAAKPVDTPVVTPLLTPSEWLEESLIDVPVVCAQLVPWDTESDSELDWFTPSARL